MEFLRYDDRETDERREMEMKKRLEKINTVIERSAREAGSQIMEIFEEKMAAVQKEMRRELESALCENVLRLKMELQAEGAGSSSDVTPYATEGDYVLYHFATYRLHVMQ